MPHWLQQRLNAYTPDIHSYERAYLLQCKQLLATQPRAFWRDNFTPGHFTGSAWVVNPARTRTLLIHHPKLNIWVQPGGHADGNPNLLEVALQELQEESGYTTGKAVSTDIFDIDVHYYPERLKNGVTEPEHLHFDVRFLIEVDDAQPIPGSEEKQTMKWLTLSEAAAATPPNNSVHRMLEKTRLLAAARAA